MSTTASGSNNKVNLVQLLVSKIYELQRMMLGQKIRKPFDYNRHGKHDFQTILEPGDIIAIEPFEQYGTHFMVSNEVVPELLAPKEINLVTSSSNILPQYDQSSNIILRDVDLTTLDLNQLQLGVYHFVVLDPMIFVQFWQPGPQGRFIDKTDPAKFTLKNTLTAFRNQDYGRIPTMAVFADTTTIKAKVGSYDPNRQRRFARILAFGWKYQLEVAKVNDTLDRNDPRIVTTIYTGSRTKS